MEKIGHAHLKQILQYDPETGLFTWLRVHKSELLGKTAGFAVHGRDGTPEYWAVQIKAVTYKAHRLAWFYMTGEWPVDLIDHKDCDGTNNRWDNLRPADNSKNQQNNRRRSDNKSGFKGVYFNAERQKWRAMIGITGRRIHLGLFATPEAAHAAYQKAAAEHFGDYARAA